jgi:mRNA interferase RelE/StbE
MYKVILTKRALKDLESLTEEIKMRIIGKLREYSHNPFNYCTKLSDPRIGTYRFRIGDFRIIFDIDDDKLVILRIGHRKEIYK